MPRRPQAYKRARRVRVGRVSLFLHRKSWWTYHREHGRQCRRRVGPDFHEAERAAAQINAEFTEFTVPDAPYTIVCSINDSGWISGRYWDSRSVPHGLVATPKRKK